MPKPRLKQLAQDGATDNQVATWDNATGKWVPKDSGILSYGRIYEDDNAGTNTLLITPTSTYFKWTTSTAGNVVGGTLVTADTANGRLVVGSTGAGEYEVEANCSLGTTSNAVTHMELRKNGTALTYGLKTSDSRSSGGQRLDLGFSGLMTLADTDYLELWFTAAANNVTLTFYQVNLNIVRLSGSGAQGPTGATGATGPAGPSVIVEDEGTPLTTAATKLNFAGAGVTVTEPATDEMLVTIPGGGGSLVGFALAADQLLTPNNADWAVNAHAPLSADSNNAALSVRMFDDTVEEGVGFSIRVPTGVTNLKIKLTSRAETAPAGARTVGLKLYNRGIPDNAAVQSWSAGNVLADIGIPASESFQYDEETLSLATLAVTAGETTQFELTRINPTAGTELTGDWDLLEIGLEFS